MNKLLFAAFSVLWLLDTVFTLMFVGNFGIDAEGNPIMRWVLLHTGGAGFVAVKLLTGVILFPFLDHPRVRGGFMRILLIGLVVMMVPVVAAGGVLAFDMLNLKQ